MDKFWVIAKQLYKQRVFTKSFCALLLVPLLLAAAIISIPKIIDHFNQGKKTKIAVISSIPAFSEAIKMDKDTFILNPKITSERDAKEALKEKEINGYLIIKKIRNQYQAVYTTQTSADQSTVNKLETLLTTAKISESAKAYSISTKQLAQIMTNMTVTNHIQSSKQFSDEEQKNMRILSIALPMVIFLFIVLFTNMIASEIASEKGSRIMEIVLSSVSATTHLLAKITAVILMILTMIVFEMICFTVGLLVMKNIDVVHNIIQQISAFPVSYVIFDLLLVFFGLLFYTVLAALMGSLAPNVATLNQYMYPITILSLLGFWSALLAANVPDNLLIKIGSYLPFFSPLIMLVRFNLFSASLAEFFSAFIILIITTILLLWLTIRLYRQNVLLYSDKGLFKTWKIAFQNAKKSK